MCGSEAKLISMLLMTGSFMLVELIGNILFQLPYRQLNLKAPHLTGSLISGTFSI